MAAGADKYTFEVDWKAFMLRADYPAEGISKEEYMGQRFGSVAAYREKLESMKQVFAEEGIEFNPEGQKTGSSLASHRMLPSGFCTLGGRYCVPFVLSLDAGTNALKRSG